MRVRRMVAAAAALLVGASVGVLVPSAPVAADVAVVDYSCDTPPVNALISDLIPDPILLEDLEIEIDDSPDPVVQGHPLTYEVLLPVPDLTGGFDLPESYPLPPFGSVQIAPYGTFRVNKVELRVPIPDGLDVPDASAVTMTPAKPWLTVEKVGDELLFRVQSTVGAPANPSPMEIVLDDPDPVLRIQESPGVWVPVTPLPDVTITGTATGAPGTTIDLKPPTLDAWVTYSKSVTVIVPINLVSWSNAKVPCVPLDPSQTITSTDVVAPAPAMSVVKALADGDDEVTVGETIHYTVAVSNTGNVPLTGITLDDPNATCEPVATTLATDASDLVECTHVTTEADLGTYTNTATADSDQTDPVSSNTVSTQVVEPPQECPPPGFTDVSGQHPFYDEICWMVDAGVTTGYPDGSFRPAGNVSRAAMAAFLQRLSGEAVPGDCVQQFSDVGTGHPFFSEICWMVRSGVTTGYPDGSFRPAGNVSRAAMAAFLYRIANPA